MSILKENFIQYAPCLEGSGLDSSIWKVLSIGEGPEMALLPVPLSQTDRCRRTTSNMSLADLALCVPVAARCLNPRLFLAP
ncbi:hypothetical protein CDAR_491131 [Caerostris darwini]|uniref:Uncharacterized protein n=1 Tax=Caerostris darwini TaxID=1538125 RepID=A0AAV4XAA1_9ARAC|nr:hypothetical protein CDAR_491131 [Caerostris darwini]